jgi:K+:H+ antiporter
MFDLFTFVLQIIVILGTCGVTGALFRRFGQPRVVGEMVAGVLLGPSLLGHMAPGFSGLLFPPSSLTYLNALSQIGLILFMFLIGLTIDLKELKHQGHAAVMISHISITVPFVLGSLLALYLYPKLSDESVSFNSFSLFLGAAMATTAFPVLARILAERNMLQSRLGTMAIACAAVDDVTGWCVLAYIVVLARTSPSAASIAQRAAGLIVFVLVMIVVVQPLLQRFETLYRERGRLNEMHLTFMLVFALSAALCTEWLGVHPLFGAFLFGGVMPKEETFVRYIKDRLETLVTIVLLPLFFAFTGLRTSIGLVSSHQMWPYCALIIAVATLSKLGGSAAGAWLMGMRPGEALQLGALMNTRGLMGLVVVSIGLDAKIVSPALFSMMIFMALITTLMTTPVLDLINLLARSKKKLVAENKFAARDVT